MTRAWGAFMSVMEHAMHSAPVVHRCRWAFLNLQKQIGSWTGWTRLLFLHVLAQCALANVLPVFSLGDIKYNDVCGLANRPLAALWHNSATASDMCAVFSWLTYQKRVLWDACNCAWLDWTPTSVSPVTYDFHIADISIRSQRLPNMSWQQPKNEMLVFG